MCACIVREPQLELNHTHSAFTFLTLLAIIVLYYASCLVYYVVPECADTHISSILWMNAKNLDVQRYDYLSF